MHAVEKPIVEIMQKCVDRFFRPAAQVYGELLPSAFELSVMEESQARAQKCEDGGRLMDLGRERGRRTRLIVILKKARRLALKLRIGAEMIAHGSRMPLAKPVVKPLVIGVVEALLLQSPFQVPVNLCHEKEVRFV